MLALARLSPVDPVEQLINANDFSTNQLEFAEIYEKTSIKNGLNKAPFYFTINRSNYQKDYYTFANPLKKSLFNTFLKGNYSYEKTELIYEALIQQAHNSSNNIDLSFDMLSPEKLLSTWEKDYSQNILIMNAITDLKESKNVSHALIPAIRFHGRDNTFHQAFTSFFKLDWGNSLSDGKLATSKISRSLPITIFILILSVIGSGVLGFLFGIWFYRAPSLWTKVLEQIFYILKSIPLFVFALFMLNTFTTSEISPILKIFPSVNAYGWSSSSGFWVNLSRNLNQLILPVCSIIFLNIPYISRQVKTSLSRENRANYNKTAQMKGLSQADVYRHKLRNIRGILVTIFSSMVISGLAGSVIIEYIFNIPGMGRLLLNSVRENDLVVMMPIVLILFILSSLVMLISDLLYKKYNPQISISNA